MKWGSSVLWLALPLAVGCVTVADFRKVERDVIDIKRAVKVGGKAPPRERLAELAARLDALERRSELLGGRVEVTEHRVDEALREARAARQEAGFVAVGTSRDAADLPGAAPVANSGPARADAALSEELAAYRAARARWSSSDWDDCVDRLGEFLQTYPSSVCRGPLPKRE